MSVTFIGSPSVTTPELGDNTERIATTEFVQRAIDFIYTGKLAQDAVGGILDISEFVYDSGEVPSISLNQISADKLIDGAVNSVFTTELKNKLDGIETSATADQTAGEILTALLTVDGATSLLDADLLDGQEGAYYAPLASPALTGTPTAPTAVTTTSTTQIATTAFVQQELSGFNGSHTVQDEGTPLTQRTNLNFVGGGVTVTDDVGNDATVVTVTTPSTINWLGTWSNATSYVIDDAVEYQGSSYIANAPSLNKIPGTDPEWDLMAAKGADVIELSADVTWYVAPDGDPEADGLTVGTPITLDEAFYRFSNIEATYIADFNIIVTLSLANGTYSHRNHCSGNLNSPYPYRIRLTASPWVGINSEPNVTITNFVSFKDVGSVYVENIKFNSEGTRFTDCEWIEIGNVSVARVTVQGSFSYMYAIGTWICRSARFVFQCSLGAYLVLNIDEVRNAGVNINYVDGFVHLLSGGILNIEKAPTITGTFTGKRVSYYDSSVRIDYGSEFIDLLPGDTTQPYPNYLVEPSNTLATTASLATVATSGSYNDLTDLPTLNIFGSVYVDFPKDDTIIKIPAGVGYTINSIKGVAVDSGTCTLAIKINGVAVTGLSAIAVTTTPQNVTATGANIVADGDLLTYEFSSAVTVQGFRGSLYVSI